MRYVEEHPGPSMQLRVFRDVSASEGVSYTRMDRQDPPTYNARKILVRYVEGAPGPSMQLSVFSDVSASDGVRSCRMDRG